MLEHFVQQLMSNVESCPNLFHGSQAKLLQVSETNKDKMSWVDTSGHKSKVKRSFTSEGHAKVLSPNVSSSHIIRKIYLNSNAYYMLPTLTHELLLALYSNLFVHILFFVQLICR